MRNLRAALASLFVLLPLVWLNEAIALPPSSSGGNTGGGGPPVVYPIPLNRGGLGVACDTAACALAGLGGTERGINSTITGITGLLTPLSLSQGGTAGYDAASARASILAAINGDNNDLLSLSALRGTQGMLAPVSINNGTSSSIAGAPQGTGGAIVVSNITPVSTQPGAGCNVGDRIGPATHNDVQANLVGAIDNIQTTITVDSDDGFPQSLADSYVPIFVKIDSEWIEVTDGYGTTTWTVIRGTKSTVAAAHIDGSIVDWQPSGTIEGPASFQVDTLTSAGPPITLTGTFNNIHMTVTAATGPILYDGSMYININNYFLQPVYANGINIVGQESGPPGGVPGVYTISAPLNIANPIPIYAGGSVATMHMLYGGDYSVLPYLTPASMSTSGYKRNNCNGTNVNLVSNGVTSAASYDGIRIAGLARQPGGHIQILANGYASVLVGSNTVNATDSAIFIQGFLGRNSANKYIYYNSFQFVIGNATPGQETGRIQIGGYVNGRSQQEVAIGKGVTIGSTLGVPVYNQYGPGLGILSTINGYALGALPPVGTGFNYWLDGFANATLNTIKTNTQCATTGAFSPTCYSVQLEADRGITPITGTLTFTPGSSTVGWNGPASLAANQPISLSVTGGSLPPELSTSSTYFVYGFPTSSTLKLATSALGPAIIPSTAGSGTMTGKVIFNGPFTPFRIVSKDAQLRRSGITGAQGGIELAFMKGGPDDAGVNIATDLVVSEYAHSNDGPTSIWRALRLRPESNQNGNTGPVEIIRGFEGTSSFAYPGSAIDYWLVSDSARTGMYLYSAYQTSKTIQAQASGDQSLLFLNTYPTVDSISGVKAGDLVCENLNCATPVNIPPGTTVATVTNAGTVTTLGLSNPLIGSGIASGATIYTIHVFTDGQNFSGQYKNSIVSYGSQYGVHEFSLLNGAVFGNAVGGAMGIGSGNFAGNIYQNGNPLNQQFSANVSTSPGVAMATNSPTLISSINLPAGNFDLSTNVVLFPSSTLVLDNVEMAIGWGTGYCGSPAVLPAPPNFGAYASFLGPPVTNPRNFTLPSGKMHFSTFVPITVCTVSQAQFTGTGASLVAGSYMTAERVMQ